jgi:hypothetical protein
MKQCVSADSVPWRLVLLRESATEILVFEESSALRLPVVEIPAHTRIAQAINARAQALWNLSVLSLFPLQADETDSVARHYAAEALDSDARPPDGARWIPVSQVAPETFDLHPDRVAVKTWIKRAASVDGIEFAFGMPGWLPSVMELVHKSAKNLALTPSGRFLQYNASPSFSLIRFETDGNAIWFKAVGEPNLREFDLTLLLSVRLPEFLPRVLMTKPEWHAWTMLEEPGLPLARTRELSSWCNAAQALALMQIASIRMAPELLAHHARDVRVPALLGETHSFFSMMRDLMDHQSAATPPPLSAAELNDLELDTCEALEDLGADGIPDTIEHLDLNPDNVLALPDRTVFLDWAETAVGHPFLSFAYLLEVFSQSFPGDRQAKAFLIRSYADQWADQKLVEDPGRALASCALLAVFAHAVSTDLWRNHQQIEETGTAGYYRSLARRMKRYRDRIRHGIRDAAEVVA